MNPHSGFVSVSLIHLSDSRSAISLTCSICYCAGHFFFPRNIHLPPAVNSCKWLYSYLLCFVDSVERVVVVKRVTILLLINKKQDGCWHTICACPFICVWHELSSTSERNTFLAAISLFFFLFSYFFLLWTLFMRWEICTKCCRSENNDLGQKRMANYLLIASPCLSFKLLFSRIMFRTTE